jgi:transposase-like protein
VIRTGNVMEKTSKELKRRNKVFRAFSEQDPVFRLAFSILII